MLKIADRGAAVLFKAKHAVPMQAPVEWFSLSLTIFRRLKKVVSSPTIANYTFWRHLATT